MPVLNPTCFGLKNFDGQQVMFVTADAGVNVFTFSFTNATGAPLPLKGGTPVQNYASGDASTFNLNFETMLSDEVVRNMEIAFPEGWDAQFYEASILESASWSLAPVNDITMGMNETVYFTLRNITCQSTEPGNCIVGYTNFPGVNDTRMLVFYLPALNYHRDPLEILPLDAGYINVTHPVKGQAPEGLGNYLGITGSPIPVYINYDPNFPVENGFTFFIKNTSDRPILNDGGSPVAYLSFALGDEDNDITTQSLADNNLTISIVTEKSNWMPSKHQPGSRNWIFRPQGTTLLYPNETIRFIVKKLITPENVQADQLSTLYFQFNNVPDYEDLLITLEMQKLAAQPSITSFSTDSLVVSTGQEVGLSWTAELVDRVTLQYVTNLGQIILLDSSAGQIRFNETSFKVTPTAENTVFTLTAYGNEQSAISQLLITVTQPAARILTFYASSRLVEVTNGSATVTFSWTVQNAGRIYLVGGGSTLDVTGRSSQDVLVSATATYTLIVTSLTGGKVSNPTTQDLKIYVFKSKSKISLSKFAARQPQPSIISPDPFKGFTYIANRANNIILKIDPATGQPVSGGYTGSIFTVSGDATKLFTYIAGSGVKLYNTRNSDTSDTVDSPAVTAMAISPNITLLYCAVSGSNQLVYFKVDPIPNKLDKAKYVDVFDNDPGRVFLAFNLDGGILYAAGSKTGIVKMVFVDNNAVRQLCNVTTLTGMVLNPTTGDVFVLSAYGNKVYRYYSGGTIGGAVGVGANPVAAILSPDGQFLYVACLDGNNVYQIDLKTFKTSTQFVGINTPSALALNAMGTMLYVTSYCDKRVTVIDMSRTTSNSSVILPQNISTGDTSGNPVGISVYEEGGGFTRLYVTKEAGGTTTQCTDNSVDLNASVLAVQGPTN